MNLKEGIEQLSLFLQLKRTTSHYSARMFIIDILEQYKRTGSCPDLLQGTDKAGGRFAISMQDLIYHYLAVKELLDGPAQKQKKEIKKNVFLDSLEISVRANRVCTEWGVERLEDLAALLDAFDTSDIEELDKRKVKGFGKVTFNELCEIYEEEKFKAHNKNKVP